MSRVLKRRFLNVGGNSKEIPVHPCFDGWDHVLLDIDPKGSPDIVCDARELQKLGAREFDAIYCSHNLEHYYHHEVPKVLQGFCHVLKPGGFAMIAVPDLGDVIRKVIEDSLDLDDVLYTTEAGIPVFVRDVFYGWGFQMSLSGQDFFPTRPVLHRNPLRRFLKKMVSIMCLPRNNPFQ